MVVTVHLSAEEILSFGLSLVGYDNDRQKRVGNLTNRTRFRRMYGSVPEVVHALWIDLQKIKNEEYRLVVTQKNGKDHFKALLLTMYFFRKYPTGIDESGRFGWSIKTCGNKKWDMDKSW